MSHEKKKSSAIYQPMSALFVLLLDWATGAMEAGAIATTGGLALPVVYAISGAIALIGITLIQYNVGKDSFGTAISKAFFAGLVCAVPLPIAGTVFGGFFLAQAGLASKQLP